LKDVNWPYLLFGVRGRIGRSEWWIASCILIIVGFVLLSAIGRFNVVLTVVLALVCLLIAYCLLAVAVKRLHDRNRRGWWIFFFALTPVMLGSIVSALGAEMDFALDYAAWAVVLVIAIWALLEFGFMPGTAGLNRYGPDPRTKVKGDPRPGGGAT
jgi:uncharacterized membrane protein YhaH (DUF805 family)